MPIQSMPVQLMPVQLMPVSVVGAVLVGGLSSRMGRAKALLEVDGVPMAQRVARSLTEAGCRRVVAVGPRELAAGLDALDDLYPGEGPLGGILTALRHAAGSPVVVVACDLPWLDAASVVTLIAASGAGEHAVMARTGQIEPLCALWQPAARDALQVSFDAGERAVHRAIATLRITEVELAHRVLVNVNTPDDLPSE